MPGYWYSEEGTAYAFLHMIEGQLYGGYRAGSGPIINVGSLGFNNFDGIMRYRSWMLGSVGDGDPTTETGNNEHSKKY